MFEVGAAGGRDAAIVDCGLALGAGRNTGSLIVAMWYYHLVASTTCARLYCNLAEVSDWSSAWWLMSFSSCVPPFLPIPCVSASLRDVTFSGELKGYGTFSEFFVASS